MKDSGIHVGLTVAVTPRELFVEHIERQADEIVETIVSGETKSAQDLGEHIWNASRCSDWSKAEDLKFQVMQLCRAGELSNQVNWAIQDQIVRALLDENRRYQLTESMLVYLERGLKNKDDRVSNDVGS